MRKLDNRLRKEERDGELIGSYFRLALGVIYATGMPIINAMRHKEGFDWIPSRGFIFPTALLVWAIAVFIVILLNKTLPSWLKYLVTTVDMLIVSGAIYMTMTYPENYPPISFFSIQVLFYYVIIMLGAFRYSPPCALYSGLFSGLCLGVIIVIKGNLLDVPYTAHMLGKELKIAFPLYNELFRLLCCIVMGAVIFMVSRRHLLLLENMVKIEADAAEAASDTVAKTSESARTINDATQEILTSSQEIFTTANEQSASVSEIVSTMESNRNLAEQAAVKMEEVANLALETQELSRKGADIRSANQEMMEKIRSQNTKTIDEIKNLADMLERINESVAIIDAIADQTKLIAFNASLEASSAGEAGARFGVVASEIRRFADNVGASTSEIKLKIEEVDAASRSLVNEAIAGSKKVEEGYLRMDEQKEVFQSIVENSQNVAARSQQVSNLTKQQEIASSQVFTTLKEISAGVKQFVIATESTSQTAKKLNDMSEKLQEIVNRYQGRK
jgi:methyl-accepting chemotaxis protein